jgi:hypothetical protein
MTRNQYQKPEDEDSPDITNTDQRATVRVQASILFAPPKDKLEFPSLLPPGAS